MTNPLNSNNTSAKQSSEKPIAKAFTLEERIRGIEKSIKGSKNNLAHTKSYDTLPPKARKSNVSKQSKNQKSSMNLSRQDRSHESTVLYNQNSCTSQANETYSSLKHETTKTITKIFRQGSVKIKGNQNKSKNSSLRRKVESRNINLSNKPTKHNSSAKMP